MSHDRSVFLREEQMTVVADWVLRLREPTVTPAEIAEWLQWCEADPQNKAAFERMQTLLHQCSELGEQPIEENELAEDSYYGQVSVSEWAGQSGPTASAIATVSTDRAASRRFAPLLLAATIAVISIGAMWLLPSLRQTENLGVTIATTTGLNRAVELPDGTQVTVAAGSRLIADYSPGERHVYLDKGEAYFEVRKDRQRPFIVHALGAKVTAVGTAFNVRAEEQVVRVAITEGMVDVEPATYASSDPKPHSSAVRERSTVVAERIRLTAGHQLTLAPTEPKPIVVSVDAQRAISWVSGTLQFVDEPLSSVIAAVNRYHERPIVLTDPRLGEHRYTGTVVADRVQEWLSGLPDVFPVIVDEHDKDAIRILADAR